MRIKCIAIGNRIMGDDSIGIKVLESIAEALAKEEIEVIYAETDVEYALSEINDGDLLFILDSTYFNLEPGTVSFTPIEEAIKRQQHIYSQHQPSLIDQLKTYKKSVKGYIVGIEVGNVSFDLDLSETLKRKLLSISKEVYKFIYLTIRGI